MGISKVILNGVTQMDVTGDTVTTSNLLSGYKATGADGETVNGGIATKTSSNLTVSGATVTAPAGYYASNASKSVASGTAGTPTASKGTVTNNSVSVTPSVTNETGYITGGTKTGTAVTVSASELVSGTKTISASGTTDVTNYESVSVASGSAKTPATTITANPTVSVNGSGLITATVSKTQSVTPTVTAGYVASGTSGTITVSGSGTSQLTTQAAQTIHPSTTDQTIASGKYLTGAQTIKAVTTTNLTADNIVEGVTVKVGDSTDDDCVVSVTGTAETGGNEFVITLTYDRDGIIPDCTYAEAVAAYTGGKNVAYTSADGPAYGEYTPEEECIYLILTMQYADSDWSALGLCVSMWTSTGVEVIQDPEQQSPPNYAYFTSNATAVPADVASGKKFFNANGYQVGTATGASLQTKTNINPTTSSQTILPDSGFNGLASVQINAMPTGTAGTPTATKGTVSNHSVSVTPSVTNSAGYITGGTKNGTAVTVSASELVSGTLTIDSSGTKDVTNYASASVASGSAKTPATTITANPTVSVSSSGLITASVSKTQSVTPTVSAGYVSSGTAGTITVSGSGTSQLTTQAAQTIHPSTTDQTIAIGKYLTGAQTIKAVTTTNLTAANIVQGVTVKIGDSTDDDCVASVTGTAETGGNDFVITLTKNASTGVWTPDCTFAEAVAAYTGGDYVTYFADGGTVEASYDEFTGIYYTVYEYFAEGFNNLGYHVPSYLWTPGGVTEQYSETAYITSQANATPADVASGKKFFNADGYQVGTASGGSGVDLKGIAERTVTSLTLPDDLSKIGNYAFASCRQLATMNIPSGITAVSPYAFYDCQALSIPQIPSGVTSIGQNGFYNCYGLAATSLPSGLTKIEAYAFYGCRNLAITSLPSGLTALGNYAFFGCYNITVAEIPSGVTSIGDYAFNACINITSISTSAAITSLGGWVFLSNSGGNAGYGMKLAHASFPNMVINNISTVFGSTMVERACQLLEDVDIGGTKVISANAFANCYKLQTLIIRKADAICTLSNVSAFLNTPMRGYNSLTGTIYVPSALISTYQTATNWATIYGEGYVTFAAIEGSEYEL